MESEARKLREEFEIKLKELQDNCPHTDIHWLPYMWAPGHFAGEVKVCQRCEKILEHKHNGEKLPLPIQKLEVR